MPSPLAHMTAGYAIYRIYGTSQPQSGPKLSEHVPFLMLAALGLSLLPDVDSVAGILLGDLGQFHNGLTHSLIVGLGVAAAVASGLVLFRQYAKARKWFLIALVSYGMHVVMDYFTIGRGVMLYWPLTSARFQSPVKLFYGLHWSDGLFSLRHVWTLLSELAFAALVMLAMHFLERHMGRILSVQRAADHSPPTTPEESC